MAGLGKYAENKPGVMKQTTSIHTTLCKKLLIESN